MIEDGKCPNLLYRKKPAGGISLIIPSELRRLTGGRWEGEKLTSSVFSLGNPNLNRPDAEAGLVRRDKNNITTLPHHWQLSPSTPIFRLNPSLFTTLRFVGWLSTSTPLSVSRTMSSSYGDAVDLERKTSSPFSLSPRIDTLFYNIHCQYFLFSFYYLSRAASRKVVFTFKIVSIL